MRYERIHLKDSFPFLGEEGCDPTVELYLPYNMKEMEREKQKRPCLIVCPGGGYEMCSEREAEPIALHFLPEGFNVFVLTYSVAPHRFPTQLLEVAALMELIYAHEEEWNCDRTKVGIMGFSAGGHLAAHYSTCYDCAEVRARFPESKPVNASVLSYPVISANPEYAHLGSFRNLSGQEELTEEEIEKFSCDRQVDACTPQAFIWHTAADAAVPVMNSLLYAQALSKHQVPYEMHIYPFGEHGASTCDGQTHDVIDTFLTHDHGWLCDVKKWFRMIGF